MGAKEQERKKWVAPIINEKKKEKKKDLCHFLEKGMGRQGVSKGNSLTHSLTHFVSLCMIYDMAFFVYSIEYTHIHKQNESSYLCLH